LRIATRTLGSTSSASINDCWLVGPRVLSSTSTWRCRAGRPAVLVSARGGSYRLGTPREGWDYAEPYLRRILGEVFGLDLRVITPELTLAEVNPALAEFKEHAKASLVEAHNQADAAARDLLRRVAA